MQKKKIQFISKLFIFLVLFVFSFSLISSAFAASLVPCGTSEHPEPCTLCHLVVGFHTIYGYLFELLLVASTIIVVIAGIIYMVSSGDKGMIEKAKSALLYALTAVVLALVAWLIINTTLHALGYRSAGSWWTFTCDTTQTTGPGTTGVGGATLPIGGSGLGKIVGTGVVSSGQMSANDFFQTMKENSVYVDRGAGAQTGWIDGKYYNDCSGSVQEWSIRGFGYDPGGSTNEMLKGATAYQGVNSLKVGDTLIVNGSHGPTGHAVMYIGDGMVMGNSGVGRNVQIDRVSSYNVAAVKKNPNAG